MASAFGAASEVLNYDPWFAAMLGDSTTITNLGSAYPLLNKPSPAGDMPMLLLAAKFGHLNVVQALHMLGATMDVKRSGQNSTALAVDYCSATQHSP
jgi:hypothetical protein